MRTVPQSLSDSLASGCTTLCRCWSVTRTDGVVMGFTDHDRSLGFDGIEFEASSGFDSAAIESSTGLSVDTHTVSCALTSASITDEDIERGLYDGAEVLRWLVDWRDTSSRLLLSRGHIGEIRRGKLAFEAEIVSLAERLNQPYGRAFLHGCDRRLGDPKCGVDLSLPIHCGTAVVQTVIDPQRFAVSGLEAFSRGWFDNGHMQWVSGANEGVTGHVKTHLSPAAGGSIELWLTPPLPVQPGDSLTVTAGCDKTPETCKAKFNNFLNFRGFPHLPGDDWMTGYVDSGGDHDGGSLFRR
jgi:uncharacterized phage protein (TIGR02218 family)